MAEIDGIPTQKHYNLTHYQQRYNWDCGLSCIIMILSTTQRDDLLKNFDSICADEGFGSSTWTIDLCYLLHRYGIQNEYLTKTLGVDPNYNQHSYYTKIIDLDKKRVTKKFKDAQMFGLKVEQRTIEMETIVRHLAKHGPVILLTNASLLTCEICKPNILEKFGHLLCCLLHHMRIPQSYAGHYVVLCGYDLKLQKLYYRNPEVHDNHICHCSTLSMDSARKAYGTDEDVLLIYNN